MGAFLRNEKAMTAAVIILTFTVGIFSGWWLTPSTPPNGEAVDGQTLQEGKYTIVYPYQGQDAQLQTTAIEPGQKQVAQWSIMLVVASPNRLVTINADDVEWKELTDPGTGSHLEVVSIEGKKKFIINLQSQPDYP